MAIGPVQLIVLGFEHPESTIEMPYDRPCVV
jgi:hypothetical protein